MANFITEDMIEQAMLKKLGSEDFGYNILICDSSPDKKDDLNDGHGTLCENRVHFAVCS